MRRSRLFPLLTIAAIAFAGTSRAQDAKPGFALQDAAGQQLDVLLDGKVVARYMYAHDTSSKERAADTYKPYLHVFDADGKAPITKGAGGDFPHHRGIYIGWNKIAFGGKTYDRWHMKGGDQVHQKFATQSATPDQATFTSVVLWQADTPDKAIVEEERTTTVRKAAAPARVVIDFTSTLKAPNGDVTLDGDPEHAGIHFRPAQEVSRKDTTYVYPKAKADARKDVDYPWVGESFTVGGKRHSVALVNHPANPKGTRYSAYRDYGRFGAFPKAEIKSGEALTVKYRFVVADGEMPPAKAIQKWADDFAGAAAPTPVPPVTARPAEGAGKTPGGNKKAPATRPAADRPGQARREVASGRAGQAREPILRTYEPSRRPERHRRSERPSARSHREPCTTNAVLGRNRPVPTIETWVICRFSSTRKAFVVQSPHRERAEVRANAGWSSCYRAFRSRAVPARTDRQVRAFSPTSRRATGLRPVRGDTPRLGKRGDGPPNGRRPVRGACRL